MISLSEHAVRYLDSWLALRQRHLRVPGVQAAVLVGDEVVLSTAHGVADLATGSPMTPAHLFRIASHSKTFTATAVLQLVESGALRLDDPVGAHLTWLAERAPKLAGLTLRELLGHGGGLARDGQDAGFWLLTKPFPDERELCESLTDADAVLGANERFKYSNIGYTLLGQVIAAAAGEPYNDYVTTHIINRLGLVDTTPELDPKRLEDFATGHTAAAYHEQRFPIGHTDSRAMSSATGFCSTASEVCKYAAAHFTEDTRLLSERSKRLMQREEWRLRGEDTGYGLGFSVDEVAGRRLFGHSGGYPGYITRTVFDPVERLAVSVLTNAIDGPAAELATGLVKLIGMAQGEHRPELELYCGRFANVWGVVDINCLGGRLLALRPGAADPALLPTELAVESARTLRITEAGGYGAPGETLEFDFDGDRIRSITGMGGIVLHPLAEFAAGLGQQAEVTLP
ncbi:serine hydrolase domain-containing protein [Kutzneria albida]|uniref:Beta-lactamase-related domain-containing protein n=1 Tax=Kutzneria albida DSM 43870 TaxID=1449976 RepID=W5WCT1_9PSEU|nr:serine hydrolase domain-containing protein [Kutzneria albida]AHH98371.1 hypothetical protein KALB_5009 [Kutzneria albida DSM 43870]